ncbi:hypothetical protein CKM354_000848700 [Cercospora kikuchii]|uniref:WSC domain-containing protein n=1 Tax=Cercospora kikuchii TaxID=84275 RepID=A0A9P3FJG1_9PEZI|nr:uncharacterized protein CKM354_000848700 [Cercospora kikuchii]GIZ45314.1 hypothetical protein CKM354_000848700 [Cercospora kikuchii]
MKMHNMLPFRAVLLLSGVLVLAQSGLVQQYCSSDNTGSDFNAITNIYQSNGACRDSCASEYAFAVVQWQSCWCTNVAPGDTTSVSDCGEDCPGYPSEKCGNRDSGLYGYIALNRSPTSTAGGSRPSPTTPRQRPMTAPSPTQEPETSYTSSRTSETPESTFEPVTEVIMTTISGAVVTQTVTSTPVAAPESNDGQQPLHRSDSMSAGTIAGIVIGILAAFAILGAALFFCWRRRKQDSTEDGDGAAVAGGKRLGRNVSVLSKAGLLARTQPSMGEHDDSYYVTPATGQNSVRHSMMFGPSASEGVNPASPLGSSHGSDKSRRMSKPMVYDQRLNPSALFANAEANGSRISMQDQQDYSRPLGVVNPDPRPSFESRMSRA